MNIISYRAADKTAVLSIFDKNCPDFFAPNERDDLIEFLEEYADGYRVCIHNDNVVGAFGLYEKDLYKTDAQVWIAYQKHQGWLRAKARNTSRKFNTRRN